MPTVRISEEANEALERKLDSMEEVMGVRPNKKDVASSAILNSSKKIKENFRSLEAETKVEK